VKKFGDVRQTTAVPAVAEFANSGGTPLVIDISSGTGYYLDAAGAVQSLAGGGGGAPSTAQYLVGALDGGLSAERLVTDTATLTWDLTTPGQAKANVVSAPVTRAVGVTFDGGGSAITALSKADLRVPYGGTITAVTMLADQVGSIVVDIWKDTYAAFPPTVGDSITAAAKPTITADDQSVDTTLFGWTNVFVANDCFRFNVDSCAAITRCTLILTVTS
jgi:hypothetical protein